ncbi:unnamed protein product, partial [Chrysoparadoxa australica]
YEAEITGLRADVDSLSIQCKSTDAARNEMGAHFAALQAELEARCVELEMEKEAQGKALEAELAAVRVELEESEAALSELTAEKEGLAENYAKAFEQLSQLLQEKEQLQARVDEAERSLQVLSEVGEREGKKLGEERALLEGVLQAQLDGQTKANASLLKEKEALLEECANAGQTAQSVSARVAELTALVAEGQSKMEEMEKDHAAKLDSIQASKAHLEASLEAGRIELAAALKERDSLASEVQRVAGLMVQLEKTNEESMGSLQEVIAEKQASINERDERIKELLEEGMRLRETLEEKQRELTEVQGLRDSLQEEVGTHAVSIENMQNMVEGLRNEAAQAGREQGERMARLAQEKKALQASMEEKLDLAQAECARQAAAAQVQQLEVESTRAKLAEATAELEALKAAKEAELGDMKGRSSATEEQLQKKEGEMELLLKLKAYLEGEAAKADEKISALEKQLNAAYSESEEKFMEKMALKTRLRDVTEKLESNQRQLVTMEEQVQALKQAKEEQIIALEARAK